MTNKPEWLTRALLEEVLPFFKDDPRLGRINLCRFTSLSMYKSEVFLNFFKENNLQEFIFQENAVDLMLEEINASISAEEHLDLNSDTYTYEHISDTYTLYLNEETLELSGETVRGLREDYSNWDGDPKRVEQIALHYELPKRQILKIKNTLGFTRNSDPFTDEVVATVKAEDLAAQIILKRRNEIELSVLKTQEQDLKDDAKKYKAFETLVLKPFMDTLSKLELPSYVRSAIKPDSFAAVIAPYDLHYGKAAFGDGGINKEIIEDRLMSSLEHLLDDVECFGLPEKIIVPMAGDFFHVDNMLKTTTVGTAQDFDGDIYGMIEGGIDLALRFLERVRELAPLEIYSVKGNHDYFGSIMLNKFLERLYADASDVEVFRSREDLTFAAYGETAFCVTHGDNFKKPQATAQFYDKCPRELLSRTTYRTYFTGHFHTMYYEDLGGCDQYSLPSLSGDDAWHKQKWFNRNKKALAAYIMRESEGVTASLIKPVRGG